MRVLKISILITFLLIQEVYGRVQFSKSDFDPSVLRIDEDIFLGKVVPDVKIKTLQGKEVFLSNLTDKPLILLMIYYDCPNICPLLGEGLADALKNIGELAVERDYNVLVLSFNHNDTLEKADRFRERLKRTVSGYAFEKWTFAIASEESINTLLKSTGYKFFTTEDNLFVHPNVFIFLSQQRKITRYIFGIKPDPFNVRLAILESTKGKIGKVPLPSLLTLACYKYNSEERGYMLNITFLFASVGLMMAIMTGVITLVLYKKRKNKLYREVTR